MFQLFDALMTFVTGLIPLTSITLGIHSPEHTSPLSPMIISTDVLNFSRRLDQPDRRPLSPPNPSSGSTRRSGQGGMCPRIALAHPRITSPAHWCTIRKPRIWASTRSAVSRTSVTSCAGLEKDRGGPYGTGARYCRFTGDTDMHSPGATLRARPIRNEAAARGIWTHIQPP
ncbi:hypothetical protein L226DRAFT_225670 [Lentinus tigrinus ALCF2SS1-7]|uniref:Uncharacterized protein n=1 Tax=Lentinus tigrinus ALCF2SS1-6 TaxID=1328759 RepID=A0A5C2RTH9_9APHY|nr:hypothetical protein L227DRAFT_376531 [Lentinus tigrinus ALCF2SS1-6]RPD70563.1 hypothetical protein L226DRAFT_225670 [Lentinus tigrinus ALCF2SS1-7]